MNTITLTIDEALLLKAYEVGQHHSLTDALMAALQAYIRDHKIQPQPHLNGHVDKPVVDVDDEEDDGTLDHLYKHAADFDIGANDLSVNLDHYLYGLPKQDE